MKKTLATLCALAILAIGAFAGEVYDRTAVLALSTNGLCTWTNDVLYASVELKRIDILGMDYAADTVTVARVTGDTKKQTNTVCGVLAASNYGSSNLVVAAGSGPVYMKYGDKLTFTSGMGSNGNVQVEYEVQKH
jgi:hypothetical protein